MPLVNDSVALVNDPNYLVNDATSTEAGAPPPTKPLLGVDVAFATAPLAEPTWTALASRSSELRIMSGRQQELDAFQPGTINGPLDNSDRALDPRYSAGPHFANLKPRKRTQIYAWDESGTYVLATGYVRGWPQGYQHPEGATTELSATDGFLLLASAELPGSVYELEVAADNPHGWWRLGETDGIQALDSSGNHYDGTYVGGATFNTRQGLVHGDPDNAIEFNGTSQSVGILSAAITTIPLTVEFWVQVAADRKPADITPIYAHGDGRNTRVSMTPTGAISAFLRNSTGGGLTTSTVVADGERHHVVFRAQSGTQQIFVDGVDRAFLSATSEPPARGPVFLAHAGSFPRFGGTLDEVAVYDYVLPLARIQAHYAAGTTPWDGDTTGGRVNKVLDIVGWPAADRQIDTGNSTLGPATLARRKALDYLQLVERTEQGALYMAPDNKVRFRERRARFYDTRMTTVQYTLTDEDLPGALHYEGDLELTFDEDLIYNEVTVRWEGGEVTVSDQTSITTYGPKGHSIDTIARTADDARWIGQWVLDHYREPQTRVKSVTVNPGVDPALWGVALASKISDRIRLRRLPQGIGSAFSIEAHIEGKEHTIGTDAWTTTFPLSTADTKRYWILGTSALGVDTYLGY